MNIIESSDKYVLNTYTRYPLTFVKGEGVWLYSDDNKKYLDLSSGIAVTNLGHAHPAVTDAICKQAEMLLHTSNLYYTKPYTELAEKLVTLSIFDKVFFCNSGAEANEAALKLSRKHGHTVGGDDKFEIITMKNSFHGRTLATITATGQTKYQKGFEPVMPGFTYVEFNNIEDLRSKVSDKTASIIVEAVQGEGGIHPAHMDFIAECRTLCDKYNCLLIFDEVQTGIGRTGKYFGYEHFAPYEPDAITLAKGLGGGMPIGAMLVKEQFASVLGPGTHASTFGGNPVSCSAANAILNVIDKEKILEKVTENGNYFRDKLNELKGKYPVVKDVRGLGLLNGIEVDCKAADIIRELMDNNVLAVPAGTNVVRFLPALIIERKEIDNFINILENIVKN